MLNLGGTKRQEVQPRVRGRKHQASEQPHGHEPRTNMTP